jgi:nickel-type superoxide dismutase maturation protease
MRWPLFRAAVAERSMEPVFRAGDWLLVWRGLSFGAATSSSIRPGQVVIARHPGDDAMLLVKRVRRAQDGGWWLSSDNEAAGAVDSRAFGPVAPELIEGRVVARYWPPRWPRQARSRLR